MGIRQCGQALLVVAGLINTVPALGALSVGKAYALVRVAIVDLVGLAVLAGGTILVRAGGNER